MVESGSNQGGVKFIAVGRLTDQSILLTHIPNASNKVYKDEVSISTSRSLATHQSSQGCHVSPHDGSLTNAYLVVQKRVSGNLEDFFSQRYPVSPPHQ